MVLPSSRIVRSFIIYGVILLLADRLFIMSARSVFESVVIVVIAILIAVLLYTLLKNALIFIRNDSGGS